MCPNKCPHPGIVKKGCLKKNCYRRIRWEDGRGIEPALEDGKLTIFKDELQNRIAEEGGANGTLR